MATDFLDKCKILGQLSVDRNYLNRIPENLMEFVAINEFILTLAWCITMDFAIANDKTIELVNDVFDEYSEIAG